MSGAHLLPSDLASQLAFPKATVTNRIRECVDRGWELLNARADGPVAFNTFRANRSKWDDQNREVLRRLFKTDATRLSYDKTGHVPPGAMAPAQEMQRLRDSVSDKISLLQAILDQLEGIADGGGDAGRSGGNGKTPIFIVHVDEPALARTVARFLETQRYAAVIVSSKPGEGEIGVMQLDAYREVRFAIVLVAGDQVAGAVRGAQPERVSHSDSVLWLGYVAGRIGRRRVCALYQPGLPVPGKDLGMRGVEYDDAGAWKTLLTKRIETAGEDS